jgi:hypothetical protein
MKKVLLLIYCISFCQSINTAFAATFPGTRSSVTTAACFTQPSIVPILSGINYTELNRLIRAKDEAGLRNFYRPVSLEIAGYISSVYGEDILPDIADFPEGAAMLALFCYGKEKGIVVAPSKRDPGNGGDPMSCFGAALGSLLGISDIRDLYNDFARGASPKTILKSLKVLGRRVATILNVAIAVYDLGDCLNWW